MRKLIKIILLIFILAFNRFAFAADDDWIKHSIDLVINTQFNQAESLLVNKIESGDSSIQVYFYYASLLNSKMTHFENQLDESEFINALKIVIEKSGRQLEDIADSDSFSIAHLSFYRGSAYGYLAYYQGKTGSWYQAVSNGLKSVNNLEKAVELDSALYDAYLGIGAYKYWRSTKLNFLLWLPFVPDMREDGIYYIKKAIEKGAYGKYMGMHQLVYILLDYKKYDEALKYARRIVEAYPKSQFMWWANAHTYYKMKNYPAAVQSYRKLLSLIEKDVNANPMHWLACQVRLAEIYMKMDDCKSCYIHCNLVLNRSFNDRLTEKGRQKLEQARQLLKKSRQKLTRLNSGLQ